MGNIIHCIYVICIVVILTMSMALGEHEVWDCPDCGRAGNKGNYCGSCAHPAPWMVESASEPSSETDTIIQTINAKDVGSIVCFGHYEQDNNTSNGKEPIEWLVLDYNATNKRALLLSRYGLDAEPYNKEERNIDWEWCTLRTWLNETFLNKAFTEQEQQGIVFTNVDNSSRQSYSLWSTNGGNNTEDKIFLLSCAEAQKYLGVTQTNDSNTKSRISPTEYAIKQRAFVSSVKTVNGASAGWWWLRSPGITQYYASRVGTGGSLSSCNVDSDIGCVRPALWISLESDFF